MGKIIKKTIVDDDSGISHIRVDKNKKVISGTLFIATFKDADTNQMVAFCPDLDITGYGNTSKEAHEMFDFSIQNYFHWLLALPYSKIEHELHGRGWSKVKLKNKEFSSTVVDINGELKNFNIEEGSLKLQMAEV